MRVSQRAYAHRNLGAVLGSGGEHAAALPHLRAAKSALLDDPAMAYGLARCLNSISGPQELQEADQIGDSAAEIDRTGVIAEQPVCSRCSIRRFAARQRSAAACPPPRRHFLSPPRRRL